MINDEYSITETRFSYIEDQLNGIERYAMHFLEEENAEFAAEQLRLTEVYFHT